MSEIATFRFPATGQQIRMLAGGDGPLFCVADICRGLQHSNPSVALKLTEEEDRILVDLRETDISSLNRAPIDPRLWFVTESGFYALALASQAPGAKAFRRWVTHEVLPSIRKTGRYEVAAIADPLDEIELANDRVVRAVALARQERAAKERALAQVAELEPEAARARQTLDTTGLSLVRGVAKRFGIKERALREFLYAERLLIRGGTSHNEPYAAHVQAGHFEVKLAMVETDPDRAPKACPTTYVTPKGEALIWKRLHEAGYTTSRTMPPPLSEQLALVAA